MMKGHISNSGLVHSGAEVSSPNEPSKKKVGFLKRLGTIFVMNDVINIIHFLTTNLIKIEFLIYGVMNQIR